MLYKSLVSSVVALRQLAEAEVFESSSLRSQVLHTRSWGNFLADHVTLLLEEVNHMNAPATPDNIHKFCLEHFNFGRDLSKIKYCAILGIPPSASKSQINKSFQSGAKRYHPDKNNSSDGGAKFRKIKEAQEMLLTMSHLSTETGAQPFDEILIRVGNRLRDQARLFLIDQHYDMVERLLFELPNIVILDDLVVPNLNSDDIKISVYALVKGCVEQSRVEVDSNWSERNYKDLNSVITRLKNMERHFKAYPEIFPKSWDTGICCTIEAEIGLLGQKARACLQSLAVATKQMQGDFRRCFIQMGFVLVKLPSFKSFTKSVMSDVLESCLNSGWGYGYLFELGLSLQKGDDASSEDERRVAQMIVTEFSHFKEVLVMVWNEEVSQKPAEDLVNLIRGEVHVTSTQIDNLDVDHRQLLNSFMSYEREYKSLVGDYIKPDADLNALVQKTLALARQVAPPNNCDDWGEDLKAKIPVLLAGVFSLLTVVKSGASYNRIEEATGSSTLGEKLLMKPHNIQVLSLLLMLGCGNSGQTSLENQLMQIRTGEGKSMILGAASVMFALLGFRVRTVCYSEYLSDRDFRLFEDVFDRFGLCNYITYSKIMSFAEDATSAKGDIRSLTESLLRGTMLPPPGSSQGIVAASEVHSTSHGRTEAATRQEILLVDEVDVFFGSEFYGQTYNKGVFVREPEIEEILKRIWNAWSQGGRRLQLSDIQSMPEYKRLQDKLSLVSFLVDNEISLMLDQVSKVDDVPYYLDIENDRIGYKMMDSINYNLTYGYSTCFAYLKESSKLKNKDNPAKALVMPVFCG